MLECNKIAENKSSSLQTRTRVGFYSDRTPIMPLEGNAKSANFINKKNGSPVIHLMYHPKSGKAYQYNNQTYVEKK